jgi:hypothetical protein
LNASARWAGIVASNPQKVPNAAQKVPIRQQLRVVER